MLRKSPVFHVLVNMLRAREKENENPEHLNLIIIATSFAVHPVLTSCHTPRRLGLSSPSLNLDRQWGLPEPGRVGSQATRFFGQEYLPGD